MIRLVDEKTGLLLLDEAVIQMSSFQRIMEDSIVSDEELVDQVQTVVDLFREIDANLDDSAKELVNRTIGELAVLFELYAKTRETGNVDV